ncbi:MAG: hypothetical protein ABI556_08990 [Gemmatimonadales bacterium]
MPNARCPLPDARCRQLQLTFEFFQKAVQHHSDVDDLIEEVVEVGFFDHPQIASELSVPFSLGNGGKRVAQKTSEFARTRMGASLHDIRGNRHRCSNQLITKCCAGCSAHAYRDAMRFDSQYLRGLPHAEISEIAHIVNIADSGFGVPSITRSRND